jgi:hypothetical protein
MVDAPNPYSFTISNSFTILYKGPRENDFFFETHVMHWALKVIQVPKTKEWKKKILHFEGN